MGLIEQEIGELRKLLKYFDNGKITPEQLNARIAVYSQVEKRAKLMLSASILALKNKHLFNRLVQANLVGDMVAIDTLIEYKEEKIKCLLEEENIVMRHECLDLSGQKKNYDVCKDCNHFVVTRRLLTED